jgi:hypothetical protein
MKRSARVALFAAVLGVGVSGATLAVADIPDSGSHVIAGCYAADGTLRVIDAQAGATCKKKETPLSWNQAGAPGAPGPSGPSGAPGAPGASGAPGVPGVTIATSVDLVKAEVAVTCIADGDPAAIDEHDSAAATLSAGTYLPVFSGVAAATPNNYQSLEIDVNATADGRRLALYATGGYTVISFSPFTVDASTSVVVHDVARLGFNCGGPSIQGTVNFLRVG